MNQTISSVVIIHQKRGEGIDSKTSDIVGFSVMALLIFLLVIAFVTRKM